MGLIYVVEDDRDISEIESFALKNSGYDVQVYENGADFYQAVRERVPSLVLLDIMLPDESGLRVTERLRQDPRTRQVPIILVTAKTTELDKVRGLDMGADDYISKPFTPLELLARVNSHLRRYSKYMSAVGGGAVREHIYTLGGLELNEDSVELTVDGEPVKLTPMEFKIVQLLIKNPGRVFSADEIYERVWNEKAVNTDTIMVHVRNIREKIEIDPKNPKYLKVVWGVGYKMEKQ